MEKNIGKTDKIIRICLAVILAALIITGTLDGVIAAVAAVIAFIMLATALLGFCGLYKVMGVCTIKNNKPQE